MGLKLRTGTWGRRRGGAGLEQSLARSSTRRRGFDGKLLKFKGTLLLVDLLIKVAGERIGVYTAISIAGAVERQNSGCGECLLCFDLRLPRDEVGALEHYILRN